MDSKDALVAFRGKHIGRTWHDDQGRFSVVDVSLHPGRQSDAQTVPGNVKDRASKQLELSPIWVQLKLQSPDGKHYRNRFSQTPKSLFMTIQSIPSKKAEPFKRWLAKAGYERVQEIEDPELVQKQMKEIYNLKRVFRRACPERRSAELQYATRIN